MGDAARFQVVADFIRANYPVSDYKTIADVAGGQGNLTLQLLKYGYLSTVIDPRKTDLSKRERISARREKIIIPRRKELFNAADASDYHLVVGLHPDEATEAICQAAELRDIVLIPCCNNWKPGQGDITSIVEGSFFERGIKYFTEMLPIEGRNRVYFTMNFK